MAEYDIADPNDPNTLRVPFMFVPHGCEPTPEWLQAHPGYVRIPAVMVPDLVRADPPDNVDRSARGEDIGVESCKPVFPKGQLGGIIHSL